MPPPREGCLQTHRFSGWPAGRSCPEVLAWCRLAKPGLTLELLISLSKAVAGSPGGGSNGESLQLGRQGFWPLMWGPGACWPPPWAAPPPSLPLTLGSQQTLCSRPAFSGEEGRERPYSLTVVWGPSHMVWGVHLRAGVSWQRPNNGLHLS